MRRLKILLASNCLKLEKINTNFWWRYFSNAHLNSSKRGRRDMDGKRNAQEREEDREPKMELKLLPEDNLHEEWRYWQSSGRSEQSMKKSIYTTQGGNLGKPVFPGRRGQKRMRCLLKWHCEEQRGQSIDPTRQEKIQNQRTYNHVPFLAFLPSNKETILTTLPKE